MNHCYALIKAVDDVYRRSDGQVNSIMDAKFSYKEGHVVTILDENNPPQSGDGLPVHRVVKLMGPSSDYAHLAEPDTTLVEGLEKPVQNAPSSYMMQTAKFTAKELSNMAGSAEWIFPVKVLTDFEKVMK